MSFDPVTKCGASTRLNLETDLSVVFKEKNLVTLIHRESNTMECYDWHDAKNMLDKQRTFYGGEISPKWTYKVYRLAWTGVWVDYQVRDLIVLFKYPAIMLVKKHDMYIEGEGYDIGTVHRPEPIWTGFPVNMEEAIKNMSSLQNIIRLVSPKDGDVIVPADRSAEEEEQRKEEEAMRRRIADDRREGRVPVAKARVQSPVDEVPEEEEEEAPPVNPDNSYDVTINQYTEGWSRSEEDNSIVIDNDTIRGITPATNITYLVIDLTEFPRNTPAFNIGTYGINVGDLELYTRSGVKPKVWLYEMNVASLLVQGCAVNLVNLSGNIKVANFEQCGLNQNQVFSSLRQGRIDRVILAPGTLDGLSRPDVPEDIKYETVGNVTELSLAYSTADESSDSDTWDPYQEHARAYEARVAKSRPT